jgi:SHS2 domain-containing protein
MKSMGSWSHFSHEADIGLCGEGATVEEAFVMTAMALTAAVTQPDKVRAQQTIALHCESPDLDYLLLDWLNAIIYEMAVRKMLFSGFQLSIAASTLTARISGEPVDRARHEPAVEPKGATLTELSVRCVDGHWKARCVIDV